MFLIILNKFKQENLSMSNSKNIDKAKFMKFITNEKGEILSSYCYDNQTASKEEKKNFLEYTFDKQREDIYKREVFSGNRVLISLNS